MKIDNRKAKNNGKPLIIPVFIMNKGCPHQCIFCNQKISAGNYPQELTKNIFKTEVESYLKWNKDKTRKVEIAFYGGNFTGLDPAYQKELLWWANSYIQAGLVNSVRISTRPDYITGDKLILLKENGVTTVEIGAQSFIDEVLKFSQRGHNAAVISDAMMLLKDYDFQTSLHLMVGLPKDTKEGFTYSLDKTIELKPDMVRIHPVIVFSGTILAEKFFQGIYHPLELSHAVELSCLAWEKLSAAGIRIIRIGLHLTKEMENDNGVLAGPIHPSLGSLVLSSVFYNRTIKLLDNIPHETPEIRFHLSDHDISSFRGLKNANISAIKNLYPRTKIVIESLTRQKPGVISVADDKGKHVSTSISGIL
ncbi:MAG: radical SAM protein [Smithellaceae bacterium]|jgi:histone acetyltransferase (RNA polymerase elongator complex component)